VEKQQNLAPHLEAIRKEWYDQNDMSIPIDFKSADSEVPNIATRKYRRIVRMFELSLLGVGTIIWALGDMVQFVPR
jgi:hypothetical protein